MSLKSALFFASLALGHVIQPRSFSCQSPQLTQEQVEVAQQMSIKEKSMRKSGMTIQASISVDVWLHAVSASESGLSSDSALQKQFDTLQQTFSPYNINLNYAGKTKTVNAEWANEGNDQEMPMKKSLRRGNYQSMNIYIVDVLPTASGYCYYPTNAPEGSNAFFTDGCTLAKSAMGLIAAHEAGHWLGLAHTFDGNNCDGAGDNVDDTPAQSGPSSGCPASRDSCPNHPGNDPIHNYMDYTSPDCWTEFTPGQIDRVNSQWNKYRA